MPIHDRFAGHSAGLDGPAARCFAVTPHASDDLPEMVRGLYVGGAGDVAVVDAEGGATTFRNLSAGQVLPVRLRAVRSTGTTATDLVGLV